MIRETPTLMAAAYHSNTMSAENWMQAGNIQDFANRRVQQSLPTHLSLQDALDRHKTPTTTGQKQETSPMTTARIVKIFIADPNENIALEKRILYRGDEKLTDLSDQELFYEIPIAEMLAKHNAERIKTVDKAQAAKFGRDIFLEPAKIRDLKMVVTTVATF